MSTSSKKFRLAGLDGVRTIGVTAVLGYHLLPETFPGGFLGVDIFFVVSGFLITALLLKERQKTGTIDLRNFWLRRLRRLVPAMWLVVTTTTAAAVLLNQDLLVGIGRQLLGSLTFSYNWLEIAHGVSYFDHANPPLFRTMWSLAIEQQFYLLWPLLLIVIIKLLPQRLRCCGPAFLLLAAVTQTLLLQHGGASPTRIYQGLDTHSLGLMMGAVLALLAPQALSGSYHPQPNRTRARVRGWIAIASLAGLLVMIGTVAEDATWLYPWGLLGSSILTIGLLQGLLAGAVLVPGPARVLRQVLSLPPIVWLGERSYALYLWHWPVWLLVQGELANWDPLIIALLATLISVVASDLSYRFVETPMRTAGVFATLQRWFAPLRQVSWQPVRLVGAVAPVAVVLVLVAGLGTISVLAPQQTAAERYVLAGQAEATAVTETLAPEVKMSVIPEQTAPAVDPRQVYVVGDSVTVASTPALQQLLPGSQIDAAVSRGFPAGLSALRQKAQEGSVPEFVVFALATNSYTTLEQVNQLLQVLPAQTKLVLVTGYGPAALGWIRQTDQVYRDVAAAQPARVRVADWQQAITGKENLLAGDKVHPGPDGGRIYAQTVKDTLDGWVHDLWRQQQDQRRKVGFGAIPSF